MLKQGQTVCEHGMDTNPLAKKCPCCALREAVDRRTFAAVVEDELEGRKMMDQQDILAELKENAKPD